jgi:signal transduction histidine kinase
MLYTNVRYSTDSAFGIGLGLFIAKRLVEAHGGRICAFNNNDGNGSTFVFSLPRWKDEYKIKPSSLNDYLVKP